MELYKKGDQYYLKAKLYYMNGTTEVIITPQTHSHIRIKVGDKLYVDPQYDTQSQRWLLPVTQEETLKFKGKYISYQAQYKDDGTFPIIVSSNVNNDTVGDSIILEEWV